MTRSNSSLSIRQNLMKDCYIDDLNNSISIVHYFKQARKMYQLALNIANERNISLGRSYIAWKQFAIFVAEKLPKHRMYRSVDPEIYEQKAWCEESLKKALLFLEDIVERMDREEDMIRQFNADFDLSDDFDSLEVSGSPLQTLSVTSNNILLESNNEMAESISRNNCSESETSSQEQQQRSLEFMLKTLGSSVACSDEDPNTLKTVDYPSLATLTRASYGDICAMIDNIDIIILKSIGNITSFSIPHPYRTLFTLNLNEINQVTFYKDDFFMSLMRFLTRVDSDLTSRSKTAVEANRCFYCHLGVATGIHPFALQVYFRFAAQLYEKKNEHVKGSGLESEILLSCHTYAGFVDANCLKYIWPREFDRFAICIISGNQGSPIISVFSSEDESGSRAKIPIIIHSDGSHFTLLTNINNNMSILLQIAAASGCVIQHIVVDDSAIRESVSSTISKICCST